MFHTNLGENILYKIPYVYAHAIFSEKSANLYLREDSKHCILEKVQRKDGDRRCVLVILKRDTYIM